MEKKKLERRRFKARDENGNKIWDLTAVSAVSQPAIEKNFQLFRQMFGVNIFLNKVSESQKVKFRVSNEEKMEITGPAMVPDLDILRFDEEAEEFYYGYFEEEDIDDFMEMFMFDANHNQANFEHSEVFTDKIKLKETWKVRNPNNDISNELGFKDISKGTWFITYKCTEPELWNEIKKSILRGFSIEINSQEYEALIQADLNSILEDSTLTKTEKQAAVKAYVLSRI